MNASLGNIAYLNLRAAMRAQKPVPLPLHRQIPPGSEYPVSALGPILSGAACAIVGRIQVPSAIAAQSVLGAASLAVQAHADVVVPATGDARPTSLFLATVAATGERKSAADGQALRPVREFEGELAARYAKAQLQFKNESDAYEKAKQQILRRKVDRSETVRLLNDLGSAPPAPLQPMLTVSEPTLAGLHKLFMNGWPALGLFSDEGGSFLGGTGMKDENRLLTAAGLSELWDGRPIKRVRSEDGAAVLPGRRLAVHLMVQPGIAERLLADDILLQQGLLSRLLVAAPESLAGTRFQRPADPVWTLNIERYSKALAKILCAPQPRIGDTNALRPRALEAGADAEQIWCDFADATERRLAGGGDWEPIRGLANKLPEHALRVAAVLQLFENLHSPQLSADAMQRGIVLAHFYASEALRLFDAGSISAGIRQAQKLLEWLRQRSLTEVGLKTIYQLGPQSLREAKAARDAMKILVDHGWAIPMGEREIDGESHKETWSIVS